MIILSTEARGKAMERMVRNARELGANAIVNVRFTTWQVARRSAELYAYGTAVGVEPERAGEVDTTVGATETFVTPAAEG